MRLRRRTPRKKGQALVEFALASTLIFLLVSATVDIGLMFFTLQALRTAAQEGATFGSHAQVITSGGSITGVDYPYQEIYNRIRDSAGAGPRSRGIVNFHDLNNNSAPDAGEGAAIFSAANPGNANGFVIVENLRGSPGNWVGECATTDAGSGLMAGAPNCYIRVTVRYNYEVFFPLMPSFGEQVPLRASFTIKARSSFVAVPNP